MAFEASLSKFDELTTLDYESILAAFRALSPLPRRIDRGVLARFFVLMNRLATLDPAQSQLLSGNHSTTYHIRACAADQIEKMLYGRYLSGAELLPDMPLSAEELRMHVAPWLGTILTSKTRFDDALYHALSSGQPPTQELFLTLSLELEEQKKRTNGFTEGVMRAIDLERQCFDEKPWEEVSGELLPLLDHAHYMVRAAAAKQLGEYLSIGYTTDGAGRYAGIPSPSQMLTLIADKEVANGNVAGGFIDGLCDRGLFTLTDKGDCLGHALEQQGFDVRQWALSLTLQRDSTAPDAPNCMPWWFPVHEFFSHDPDAVLQMYEAGHRWIAAMTALEDAPEEMLPMIERLANDPDPRISTSAREHLTRRA